jgi:dCMP deaminase
MEDLKWSRRWLKLAHEVSAWSKDDTQVGAVMFDRLRNPRGFGYNGIPRGLSDTEPLRLQKPLKNWYFEHAERNVIYACSRNGISCDDCTIAITHWPCVDCTRAIIQSGISQVIVDAACLNGDNPFFQKWQDQIEVSKSMLQEVGIDTHIVHMHDSLTHINKEQPNAY